MLEHSDEKLTNNAGSRRVVAFHTLLDQGKLTRGMARENVCAGLVVVCHLIDAVLRDASEAGSGCMEGTMCHCLSFALVFGLGCRAREVTDA